MEKWLDAFAKGLLIQSKTESGMQTEPASAEQIEAFRTALRKNLDSQGTHRYLGDVVTYDYHRGQVRGRHKWHGIAYTESPNGNLATVLLKLPNLSQGESYTFPTPTYITFRVINIVDGKTQYEVINVCDWIQQNL